MQKSIFHTTIKRVLFEYVRIYAMMRFLTAATNALDANHDNYV